MSKIAILGTGAMGSVYAGLLADAGNEVWAVDTWAEHIEAIRRNGLRVEGASGDRVAHPHATTDVSDIGDCELVVIATKARDVVEAAASAKHLVGDNTTVLTIQNGLGSAERIAGVLGRTGVAVGIVGGFGASIPEPGHVRHEGWEMLHMGELDGPVSPTLAGIASVWSDAGFRVSTYDDIELMVWEKFICNVCFSGTCAVTGLTIGEVIADEQAWKIASGCATEAWNAARAQGIGLTMDDPVEYVRTFGSAIPDARPSMLLDVLAGRPTEIDVINGAVPEQAERAGLRAPYNEVVAALVRRLDARLPRSA
ncbi:ketopantoate reductase family protein [Prauserella cavernicola]|uniref:2-dehydropantoate 2-reductase n=1 Tax=Prauserella cavernicola TaxID=2800127 RepID=A0A934V7Z8_9PSEU|nr:2-dehydropantoate 2-reductase [Prauserella cavernicola]MBK1789132.1 2-dehydropantoate 2-reductase [Prauserella cavernicola]